MSLTNVHSRAELTRHGKLALSAAVQVNDDAFTRVKYAVDASHFMFIPEVVLTPKNVEEVSEIFSFASQNQKHITFRSGGTSLSGQGVTDGLLVDTRRNFQKITVLDEGLRVKVEPGATVRQVNARLAKYGRKLGPDPASEIACTIGGVIANNSSGMACGIKENSYQTLESAVIVLPSGLSLNTADPHAEALLKLHEPNIHAVLGEIRNQIVSKPELRDEVIRQYLIKNTMGYSLNSLIDHEDVVQILLHLMVGSEGTLGFVSEATFRTVPLRKHNATAFLIFENLKAATDSLTKLIATNPATIELLDAASIRVVKDAAVGKGLFEDFEVVQHAGLLVEYQAEDQQELAGASGAANALFSSLPLVNRPNLSSDAPTRNALWALRKGLYAAVAGARPSGTTALLEDIAVPVERLSDACEALHVLFRKHGYSDAVIFGHAKDGNIHFLVNEDFTNPEFAKRYEAFTEDLVSLVLNAGGSLKAEHGTGRTMAPFVERQFGAELYQFMKEIKTCIDPLGILNPGVLISSDPKAHVKNIKETPTVEAVVDNCVECGYCEPVCPSKELTTTPRQRIVIRRAIEAAKSRKDFALVKELSKAENYNTVETCAVDGMCATACPLSINTGSLVRELRSQKKQPITNAIWNSAANNWGQTTKVISDVLTLSSKLPANLVTWPNLLARKIVGDESVPLWSSDLPSGGKQRKAENSPNKEADFVYFRACVGTMFGSAEQGVQSAFESLVQKAGLTLVSPDNIANLCCGTPWKSKGLTAGYQITSELTLSALREASLDGQLPIVCDNSSCSEGLIELLKSSGLKVIDAVDFVASELFPRLEVAEKVESIAIHPTCSSTRLGSNDNLVSLAKLISDEVFVPETWGCCGFAGDRGMLHPELTASATRAEAETIASIDADHFASCNRTCEIGMTRATGKDYVHLIEIIDQVTHEKSNRN